MEIRRRVFARRPAIRSLGAAVAIGVLMLTARAQQEAPIIAAVPNLPDAPGLGTGLGTGPIDAEQNQIAPSVEKGTCIISGTVLDTNNDVIQEAHVVLTSRAGTEHQMQSGSNGEFAFSALPPGSYRVTVTGNGMGTYVSPWLTIHPGENRIVSQVVLPVAAAASSITVTGTNAELKEELADQQVQIAVEQRVFGVLPNFYSTYDWNAPPMGTKQKFKLAFRSAIDPVSFAGAAVLAGLQQINGSFPGYGGGMQGYAKRFAAAYANDVSGRMFSSAIYPSLFHQDPRYFYKGTGSFRSRAFYAISAAVISRSDSGRWQPNYSHVLGNFTAGALSNLYYPADSRGVSLTLMNGLIETLGNAGNNLMREFVLKGITTHAGGKP